MCGCDRHWSRLATCTCSCSSHAGLRPRHRADVPMDSPSPAVHQPGRLPRDYHCPACAAYVGRHRAEAS